MALHRISSSLWVWALFLLPLALCGQENQYSTLYFEDVTATHLPVDPKTHALDIALADVNGDGALDLILALENEPNRLYLNDGQGKFSWKKGAFKEANHDTEHVRLADFNKDAIIDVLFVAEDDQNHEYYLGNGDATFRDVSERLPAKSEGNGLDVGDLNGDGLIDIVIGNSGKQLANFVWLNNPEDPGTFKDVSRASLPAHLDQTQSVKLFDADGDGDLDMALGNEAAPSRLYFNNGKGVFVEREGYLKEGKPMHTREVLAFDANGDGFPDLFFANLTSNAGKTEFDPRGRLMINQGNGKFKDETEEKIPSYDFSTYAAHALDYDGDGDLDILLSALRIPPFEAMQVQALENDGKGKFTLSTEKVIPKSTVERSWGMTSADLNGDNKTDLLIGAWGGQVRLLLGK